ncbi:MAG TPA: glutaredoxin family protein [Candidatus Dormibacteraeota bacterium]|nr:glutaredoxin family protein [Candidatus Dormibacteraeota bacterium]
MAWLLYLGLIPVLLVSGQWLMLATWIVLAPTLMWLYIRSFPSISRFMGYGRVDDRPALIAPSSVDVTLYTALGCPFCPIVKRRLTELQRSMGFRLHEVDVTARPDVLIRKGIWAVPVVEARGAMIVGHATSDQLANLISGRLGEVLPRSSGFVAQH